MSNNVVSKSVQQDQFPPEKIEEFQAAFNYFDKDSSGMISKDELETVLIAFGQAPTSKELDEMISAVDIDGNHEIDFQEFLTMMANSITSPEEEIRTVFKMFEDKSTHEITSAALKNVMDTLGEKLTEEQIQLMIKELDIDGDGAIGFDEFRNMAIGKKM